MLIWISVAWLALCIVTDMFWRKLPNVLTLGMYIPALLLLIFSQNTILGTSVASALAGWAIAVLLTLPAYVINWLGAGDVKLLSVMGLIGGLSFILFSFVFAALVTFMSLMIWHMCQRFLPFFNLKLSRWGYQLPNIPVLNGRVIPFGAMLAIGGILTLLLNISKQFHFPTIIS